MGDIIGLYIYFLHNILAETDNDNSLSQPFLSVLASSSDFEEITRIGVALITTTDYHQTGWHALKRKEWIEAHYKEMQTSSWHLAQEMRTGYEVLHNIFPTLVAVMAESMYTNFSDLVAQEMVEKPKQAMESVNSHYFKVAFTEARDFLYDLEPQNRKRRFGQEFSDEQSISLGPDLLNVWLTRNVNDQKNPVRKVHENGSMKLGLFGSTVCPANSILIKNVLGELFMTHQLAILVAKEKFPEIVEEWR